MPVLQITYDLKKPGQDYSDLLDAIKSHDGWARLSESCYAIATRATPDTVYGQLAHFLDDNDSLYVISLEKPFAGRGLKEVNDWLDSNLTY